MACQIPLRSIIGTSDNGGIWTAVGTIANLIVNGNLIPTVDGNFDFGSDNPVIDVSQVATGTYQFNYSVNGAVPACGVTATASIVVNEGSVTGANRAFTVCPNIDQNYILYDFLLGAGILDNGNQSPLPVPQNEVTPTNGTTHVHPTNTPNTNGWTVQSGTPGAAYVIGANPPFSNTFNPLNVVGPNIVFAYTVTAIHTTVPPADPACPNCTSTTTITFNINDAPSAGSNASVTLCNDPGAI